jgi:AraC-like DNA-binding protein/mannose-6-phosphate isomerase-like protein (cupin superfamily)
MRHLTEHYPRHSVKFVNHFVSHGIGMAKEIKTLNTYQFIDRYMPDAGLRKMMRTDYGRFFIVDVQDMIKVSKVPVPPTRSENHSIIFLTAGEATMTIGLQKVKIKKNECLVVPAGQVFSYDRYEVNTGFICNFDNRFLNGKYNTASILKAFEFLKLWANPVIRPSKSAANYLTQTFTRVRAAYAENGLGNPEILQSYFLAALFELNAAYKPLDLHAGKAAADLTRRFQELLHQHFRSRKRVTEYAAMLKVSPNHLNKTLKTVTNKSTSKHIDEMIVHEGKILLMSTDNPIADIAARIGVDDHSYFSRLFRKYENMTPLEFRKKIEKS